MATQTLDQQVAAGIRKTTRIFELDGLRGLAMLMLLLTHFGPVEYQGPGNRPLGHMFFVAGNLFSSGIDCFFVLSGFVIGGLLLLNRDSPNYYRDFYIRRYYRTFPLYFSWLAISAVVAFLWRRDPAFAGFFQTPCWFLLFLFFAQNWFYGHNWFWKPTGASWYFLGPTWTVAVEEQYYLLAPFLVKKLSRQKLLWVLVMTVIAGPVIRYIELHHAIWGYDAAYSWTFSRMDELALGMIAAVLNSDEVWRERIRKNLNYLYGAMTLLLCAVLLQELLLFVNYSGWGSVAGRTMQGCYYFCLVLALINDPGTRIAAMFRSRLLQKLATISYGTYIIQLGVSFALHRLLLHQVPEIMSVAGIGVTLLSIAVTFVLASLSWKYLEKPLVERGRRRHAHKDLAEISSSGSQPLERAISFEAKTISRATGPFTQLFAGPAINEADELVKQKPGRDRLAD